MEAVSEWRLLIGDDVKVLGAVADDLMLFGSFLLG